MDKQLTEYGKTLYSTGLQVLELSGKNTSANQKKLMTACRDAERWIALQEESRRLYEATIRTPYPSSAWMKLLKIDKQLTKLACKFLMNARMYGWTPLARCIIRQHLRKTALHEDGMIDPLEGILSQNERRMKPEEIVDDPMEEVLAKYEHE